ncbi:MAG: Ig-like domain-containing protein, partial [Microscillaceae bacterium]|nr:Ig-like domain-containing protein [Microscillaceae bacterium]
MTPKRLMEEYFNLDCRLLLFLTIIQVAASSPVLGQTSFKINFSDAATAAPSGWLKDYGQPYGDRGNGLTYGWVDPNTRQAVDISARGRNRNPTPDVDIFRETFMHMRFSDVTAGTQNGDWEIAIPNGSYRVTLQVGDADIENSIGTRHLILADGVQIIDFSAPQGTFGVRNGSAIVNVTDGKLSVNGSTGKNVKIHYIMIESTSTAQTPVVLTSDPVDGLQNVFLNQAISAKTFSLPNGAINPTTINNQTVRLFEITGNVEVPSTVTFSNGQINLQPNANLKPFTNYRYIINGVKDQTGADLLLFSANFTTGNELYVPPVGNSFKVNFSDEATTPPSGWLKDFGEPFGDRGNGISYGWVDPVSRNPVSLVGRGRNRTPSPDKDIFRETFMHMRYGDVSVGAQNGDWEIIVPNGTYRVTIQIGESDPENFPETRHIVVAEGLTMIDFTPVLGSVGVRNATKVITVTDGRLSVNAGAVDR